MANIYYEKFINFFKNIGLYDENAFNYLRENSILFDYKDEDQRNMTGYHYYLNKERNLSKINLFVPFIDSEKTLLINIHEYTHGLMLYNYLGKKYKHPKYSEVLPILLEKIYIEENQSEELNKFEKSLNNQITKNSPIEYKIALELQDELYNYYNKEKNINKLNKQIKKLTRRM